MNEDYIVRVTAANGGVRAYGAYTAGLVEEARRIHDASPVATAALGRLLTAGAIMGSMQKGEKDVLTLIIKGDGPLGGIVVTANAKAQVKGYAYNPGYVNPPNHLGKFDVGGAIGYGTLTVIKDSGMKEPYSGTTELVTGEIAEDLTYYFAASEQTPSSVALGVLMNKENTVRHAGGFIVQMMPGADDGLAEKLEKNLEKITSVTSMLDSGMMPEDILAVVFDGLNMIIGDRIPAEFLCGCDKERVTRAILCAGKKEIEDMINAGKETEVRCSFCNTYYTFSVDELKEMLHT